MKKLSKFTLGLFILLVSTTFIFAQNNALDFDGTGGISIWIIIH